MTVKDLLTMVKEDTTFQILGTTDKGRYIKLAYGTVKDIKFPLVPYGDYEVNYVTVMDSKHRLFIQLENKYKFSEIADINSELELADITSNKFTGYLKQP